MAMRYEAEIESNLKSPYMGGAINERGNADGAPEMRLQPDLGYYDFIG